MNYLIRAIRLIAEQTVNAIYMEETLDKPIKITFKADNLHPDAIMNGMNNYFNDMNKEGENHLQQQHSIDGVEVYEFKNKAGVRGALALTTDQYKAQTAFVELKLMEKSSITREKKEKREVRQPDGKAPELQLVVTEASEEQANRIASNLELISQQAGMPLKVVLKAKGDEWEYSFHGKVDESKIKRLQEKVNDYLYQIDFEWVEQKKTSNVGDYSYEPTYL